MCISNYNSSLCANRAHSTSHGWCCCSMMHTNSYYCYCKNTHTYLIITGTTVTMLCNLGHYISACNDGKMSKFWRVGNIFMASYVSGGIWEWGDFTSEITTHWLDPLLTSCSSKINTSRPNVGYPKCIAFNILHVFTKTSCSLGPHQQVTCRGTIIQYA